MNTILKTSERIVLRRLNEADLTDFQAYRTDPEVARYQGWSHMSDDDATAFLKAVATDALLTPGEWCQIGIALRDGGLLIGDIGVHIAEDVSQAEIGFSLNRNWQGKGLAFEAASAAIEWIFAETAVPKVVGITDERNVSSIRLLKRLGMQRTETLNTVFQGEPCVEYVFEMTRFSKAANVAKAGSS